jgi:hypothetical protein
MLVQGIFLMVCIFGLGLGLTVITGAQQLGGASKDTKNQCRGFAATSFCRSAGF